MVSGINSALSGYAAATKLLNTSANNIANQFSTQTTNGNGQTTNQPYVPQQVAQSAQATGGVTATNVPVNPPTVSVYNPSDPAANSSGVVQAPNVDPAQQLVQGTIASYDAQANLKSIKVQSETIQQVLNIIS